jgi:hypothetical protein
MHKLILTATLGAASILVAGCGDGGGNNASGNGANASDTNASSSGGADGGNATGGGNGSTTASSDWPRGARVVEENGVTFRVDPDGTRVRLGTDTRIVVDNGVRYRVAADGTRVRINEQGVDVDLDGPDIPGVDVDIGTNRKGNLDVDVNTNGQDATPRR